MIKRDIRRFI